MINLNPYFFGSLPEYFPMNDTYSQGTKVDGLLERYLRVFKIEAELYANDIKDMPNIIFPSTTESKFLSLIAFLYGNPPDTLWNESVYIKLLNNIVHLTKVKGTEEGVRKFFQLFGADAELTLTFVDEAIYDGDDINYDQSGVRYDGACWPCVQVSLNVLDPDNKIPILGGNSWTEDIGRAIEAIVDFLFPINAQLTEFTYNGGEDKSPRYLLYLGRKISITKGSPYLTYNP